MRGWETLGWGGEGMAGPKGFTSGPRLEIVDLFLIDYLSSQPEILKFYGF